ncbi:hypothetical protein ATANTOWER_030666 [Ataeniobius toweri]|uniref:Mucin-15 n=1 Tax=Ataeniobius toweri TaxID=208326 RepID=A0ABU7AW16_9TELE|nr:hypothetical protein [Ataeniobius toweri]
MRPLQITASLLLLLQVFHLVCLQNSTDSPGRTIDKSWLRQLHKTKVQSENATFSGESEFDQEADQVAELNNEFSSGVTSGLLAEEEENITTSEVRVTEAFDGSNVLTTIMPPAFESETTQEPKLPDPAISPRNVTTETTDSSQSNMTDTNDEFNSTMTANDTTSVTNYTNLQSTTTMEKPITTTATPEEDIGLGGLTEHTSTSPTTTAAPEIYTTTTKSLTTTAPPSETTEMIPETTTTEMSNSPDLANKTGKIGSGSERSSVAESGSEMDPYRSKRNVAWLAVLGTAAATAVVGLVAYIILKKKHQKAFTHSKLVEEYPSDPVLRLDNCKPLDLNFGGSAYYNPALQGDSIQMTSIPGRH